MHISRWSWQAAKVHQIAINQNNNTTFIDLTDSVTSKLLHLISPKHIFLIQ